MFTHQCECGEPLEEGVTLCDACARWQAEEDEFGPGGHAADEAYRDALADEYHYEYGED